MLVVLYNFYTNDFFITKNCKKLFSNQTLMVSLKCYLRQSNMLSILLLVMLEIEEINQYISHVQQIYLLANMQKLKLC